MDRGELKNRFYSFLQASVTKGPWDETLSEEYIHEAHMRMWARVANLAEGFFRTFSLVNEVAGQSSYFLPANCHKVNSIERVVGANSPPYFLQRITYQPDLIQAFRSTVTTLVYPMPESYYQSGQKAFTLMRASQSSITGAFRVTYTFVPAKMTADNHVPFQQTAGSGGLGTDDLSAFHDLIAWYAIETAAMQSEEANIPLIMQRIQTRETELDRFLRDVNEQEPRFVNITDNAWEC